MSKFGLIDKMINKLKNNFLKTNNPQFYWICFFVLTGIFLRFLWIEDMEWKWDEHLMYKASVEIAETGKLPATGMKSGGGIENPGMSMWIFGIIAKITTNPVEMVIIVVILNVLALIGFLFLAFKKFKGQDKDVWMWGLALAAVSPMAILFSRKLWAQDILPVFTFLLILGHQFRVRKTGAFIWGFIGAIIGQIHMSGFFFSLGLFLYTLWYDYKNKHNTKWLAWLIGSIIGAVSLIPWLIYLTENVSDSKLSILHIFQFNFFIYWFIDPLGLNLTYSLRNSIFDFLTFPWIKGYNTYLVALIHTGLIIVAIFVLYGIIKLLKNIFIKIKDRTFINEIKSDDSNHNFYLISVLIGLGIIMTLSCIWIHPHYLIVAFPLPYIFIVKMLYPNLKKIKFIIILQLLLSISFLNFIHRTQGPDRSDYGKTYIYKVKNNQLYE